MEYFDHDVSDAENITRALWACAKALRELNASVEFVGVVIRDESPVGDVSRAIDDIAILLAVADE